ncbi:hypothetical protein GF324_13595 [bacterium]|nr:hypothetical protein [bacterium]
MRMKIGILAILVTALAFGLVNAKQDTGKKKSPQQKMEEMFIYDWENRQADTPEKVVFQTDYLGGTQIVFEHEFHTDMLEIECIECHHVEGCRHCHRDDVKTVDVAETKVALHKTCYTCHEGMTCTECHEQ